MTEKDKSKKQKAEHWIDIITTTAMPLIMQHMSGKSMNIIQIEQNITYANKEIYGKRKCKAKVYAKNNFYKSS